jgi:hypothetical protein
LFETLLAARDLFADVFLRLVEEAGVGPMAVGKITAGTLPERFFGR